MNKIKLKKIVVAVIMTTFITALSNFKVYASNGLTAYVEDTYGNNVIIEGNTLPDTAVTIKLIRIKDNNIRYTNEIKSDVNGKFKFSINTEADEYKTLVSSIGLTLERQLKVNNITKGIAYVRIEGKDSTILKATKVDIEEGYTTYNDAIIKCLKDNNIPYVEEDGVIKQIGNEENFNNWTWKVKGRSAQITSKDLVKENDEIILVPGDLQNPKITRLRVSPMDKDIVNEGCIETTKGSSFVVKLEQLDVDMFGDTVLVPLKGQTIKFNDISKTTDENGEVIFVANKEGTFNISCETSMNEKHDDIIRPVPISIVVNPKLSSSSSSGGSSGGGGGASVGNSNNEVNKENFYLRLWGNNRYETSVNIGNEYIKNSQINGVILALGKNFPDALSGSVLSNKYKMPIILSGSTVKDSYTAISYIEKNLTKDKQIYILGGTGGVGKEVEKHIKSKGYTKIQRLGGKDRFETNGKIVDEFKVKEGTPVIIASGENFPDALSISAVAGAKGYPILLVTRDNISNTIKDKLNKIKPSKVFIVGGTGSVSDTNLNTIKNITGLNSENVNRIWGEDRYDTSLSIAKHFKLEGDTVTFANGENFPDALSGSALSSLKNAPLILINNNDVSKQRKYIKDNKYTKEIFYGGDASISSETVNKLK